MDKRRKLLGGLHSREQRDLATMRETFCGSNSFGETNLNALRFNELKQAFAVSAHVAVDFRQRWEFFAFGLTDVLSRDLWPSLCALVVIREEMYFSIAVKRRWHRGRDSHRCTAPRADPDGR